MLKVKFSNLFLSLKKHTRKVPESATLHFLNSSLKSEYVSSVRSQPLNPPIPSPTNAIFLGLTGELSHNSLLFFVARFIWPCVALAYLTFL